MDEEILAKMRKKIKRKNKIRKFFKVLPWIAMGLSLIGCVFINYQNIIGFYFWVVSNLLWILNAKRTKQHAQLIMFIVFLATSLQGIYLWL